MPLPLAERTSELLLLSALVCPEFQKSPAGNLPFPNTPSQHQSSCEMEHSFDLSGTSFFEPVSQVRPVEHYLHTLPALSSDLAEVRVSKVHGAKLIFVHLLSGHPARGHETASPVILQIQDEIGQIISKLKDRWDLPAVYGEGITQDLAAQMNRQNRELRELYEGLGTLEEIFIKMMEIEERAKQLGLGTEAEKELKELKNRYDKKLQCEELLRQSAILSLNIKNGIMVKGAEDPELLARLFALKDRGGDSEEEVRLHEEREDINLANIAIQGDAVAVISFGGWHTFAQNIDRWNRSHPDQRFNLVEITPAQLKRSRPDLCIGRPTLTNSIVEIMTPIETLAAGR